MKITPRFFERLLASVESDTDTHPTTIRRVLLSAFDSMGVEIEADDEMIWVERTWIDVLEGDIVRPPSSWPGAMKDETHAAIVAEVGPVNHWHASPNANEYRPNESPLEWSAIRVTLKPLDGRPTFSPEHGMKPDAGVEIKVTRAELAAIEACGGWANRIGVLESSN